MADWSTDPRLRPLRALSERQGGVLTRRQLYFEGLTRWEVDGHLRAGRWQRVTDQVIGLHNGPIDEVGHRWAAVVQGGPRAYLDGASALIATGLKNFDVDRLRVSVPRGAKARRTAKYDIRQTRRWSRDDIATIGIPRARPAVAAVRGALWAKTDPQARLLLSMTVQQGLCRAEDLGVEALRVRRHPRRRLLHSTIDDLLGGARSLGELDVARELRRRGIPAPQRQVVRKASSGRYYLDLYWLQWRLVVEVDGIQHSWAQNVVGDALRQNELALAGDIVLRLPLLGLRVEPDRFYAQISEALYNAGWRAAT